MGVDGEDLFNWDCFSGLTCLRIKHFNPNYKANLSNRNGVSCESDLVQIHSKQINHPGNPSVRFC